MRLDVKGTVLSMKAPESHQEKKANNEEIQEKRLLYMHGFTSNLLSWDISMESLYITKHFISDEYLKNLK